MFGLTARFEIKTDRLRRAVERGNQRSLGRIGGIITQEAEQSIQISNKPSPEGQPPHTRGFGSKSLRKAFRSAATATEVVAGPAESVIGTAGEPHEFGRRYRGRKFGHRPFMAPALKRSLGRIPGEFAGSITT